MRLSRKRTSHTSAMNMTPMIDIVFLLLIFFMTVSQVSEVQKEQLELPQLEGSEDQQQSTLIINVDEQGRYMVGGNRTSMARVLSVVSDELAGVGDNPDRLRVVLRGDRRADSRAVNEIVRALTRLQVKRVFVAVQRPR